MAVFENKEAIQYKALSYYTIEKLNQEVNMMLSIGWKLKDSIKVTTIGPPTIKDVIYTQVMIRYLK